MRYMTAVAAALVAIVALSSEVSSQTRGISNNAYLDYQTAIPGPMQTETVTGRSRVPIGHVMLARDTRGWYVNVSGIRIRNSLEAPPRCVFKSSDRAFLFEFYRQLMENLSRAIPQDAAPMRLDCTRGTGPARDKLINLDETPFVMLVGELQEAGELHP